MLARRLDIEHPRTFIVIDGAHTHFDFRARFPIGRRGIIREDARPPDGLPFRCSGFRLGFGKAEREFSALLIADVLDVEDFDFHLGGFPLPMHHACGQRRAIICIMVQKSSTKNPAPLAGGRTGREAPPLALRRHCRFNSRAWIARQRGNYQSAQVKSRLFSL